MITRYPEDMKDFRRADLTAPDDLGRVSTSKMEQHVVAFMHKHVLNQSPTIQGEANTKFTEKFNEYLDAKEQVKKELSTKPLTLENLNQALSNLSTLRTPLNRNLINKLGKQLHKPEVREELNSLLTDFFAGVLPTTVSGVVVPAGQTAPTKRAPEQEKPRQAPETEPETPPTKESTVDTAPIEQTVETALKEKAYGVKDSTTKIKAHLERIANGGFKNGTNSVSDEHAKFMSILASYILKKLNSKGGLGVGIYEATAESILVKKFKDVYGFVTHKNYFWEEFQKNFEDENDYQLIFMPGQLETNYDQNFMHELLHVLTVPGLTEGASPQASQKAREFHDELVALQVQLYEQLEAEGINPRDLFEATPSELTEREFIANLSNPRFLAKVKETKIDFSSFFKDLFTAILKWLGVPTETQEDLTILDGMIGSMEKYLGDRIWTEEPIILTPTPPVQQPNAPVQEPIAQPNPKAVKEQIQQLELELANLERELEEAKQAQEMEDTIPEVVVLKTLKGAIKKESAERESGVKVGKDIDRYYIAQKGRGSTIQELAEDLANDPFIGSTMDEGEIRDLIIDMIQNTYTKNLEQYVPAQAPIKRDIQQLKAEIKDLKEMGIISTEGKVVPMKSTAEDSASQEPAPFDPTNMDEVVAWVKVVFNENQYNQQGYNRVNKKYSQEALNAIAEAFNILIEQQESIEAKAPEQEFNKASNEQFIA